MPVPIEFSFLCKALATDKSDQDHAQLRELLASPKLSWEKIIPFTNQHFLAPALYHELCSANMLDAIEPEACRYLNELYSRNKERNDLLCAQLHRVIHALNAHRIVPIVLKGGAYLIEQTGLIPAKRMLCDLDLYVRPRELYQAVERAAAEGYQPVDGIWYMARNTHHYAPLFHPGEPAIIELHEAFGTLHISNYVDDDDLCRRAQSIDEKGQKLAILAATDQLLLNIMQSQVQDRCFFRTHIPLRQLFDFVTLAESKKDSIDWELLQSLFRVGQRKEVLASYLKMAEVYLNWQPPKELQIRSNWHFPLCQLRLRAPLAAAPVNLALGVCGTLERQAIRQRYGCGNSLLSVNYHRLRHLLRLISQAMQPKQLKRLLGIAKSSANRTGTKGSQSTVESKQEISVFPLDDKFVVFVPETSAVHVLSETAVALWKSLAEGASAEEMTEVLVEHFGTAKDEAEQSVQSIIELRTRPPDPAPTTPLSNILTARVKPEFLRSGTTPSAHASLNLKLLGHQFRINCPDDLVFHGVKGALGHLTADSERESDSIINVYSNGKAGYLIEVRQRLYFTAEYLPQVVPIILSEVQRIAGKNSKHWLAIHAAALRRGSQVILFPGVSGSGKSSLTAGLTAHGYDYICDDLALLIIGDRGVAAAALPIPLPISLKQGSWPLLERGLPKLKALDSFEHGRGLLTKFLLPESRVPENSRHAATHIVFPTFREGAAAQLTRLNQCDALLRLTVSGYTPAGPLDRTFVSQLVNWLAGVQAFTLEYDSLDDARANLADLANDGQINEAELHSKLHSH